MSKKHQTPTDLAALIRPYIEVVDYSTEEPCFRLILRYKQQSFWMEHQADSREAAERFADQVAGMLGRMMGEIGK